MSPPRFYSYALPLRTGGVRRGVLVECETKWSEAAPLLGWSRESYDDVLAWIRGRGDEVPASMRCALDTADWPVRHPEVPINALLSGSAADILASAKRVLREGCRCLKIKSGGLAFSEIPPLLDRILESGTCVFRLDPNRSWSLSETLQMAESLRDYPVEYFEEPISDADGLPRLIRESVIPIALDETLREILPDGLEKFQGAVAVVLKPTLMGGFSLCREFAEAADSLGMTAVVSAAYESGVGIHALGRFAASLAKPVAAGLDTYSRLEFDVLARRLDFSGFVFRADQPLPDVDRSRIHLL